MKPRQNKSSGEAATIISALRLEIEYLKAKESEYVKTIETQNKNIDALRTKNAEFVKNVEANNAIIKNLNARITEYSKECLILKANNYKVVQKMSDMYDTMREIRKTFLMSTNYFLELEKIMERNVEGDLTLGRDSHIATISSISKSPVKAVQPMISGHIIQSPTISISKSDSQHINYLIQHRNDNRHDLDQLNTSNDLNDSATNVFNNSTSDTLQKVNTTNENIANNLSNGDVYNNNENYPEDVEYANENVHYNRRLSTVLEMSSVQPTLTNNTSTFSNSVLLEPELSKNSANSSSSSGKSKRRCSIVPSPIDACVKVPRKCWQQISYRNKSNPSSLQNSVSSIGMSTRGSSSGLQSAFTSEDPLEGPSTLLDQENDFITFSTSTPLDTQKKIGKKSPNNAPVATDYITIRKTNRNLRISKCAKNNENSEKLNVSKSLNDLSDIDSTIIEITELKSSVNTKIRKAKKISTSLFQGSPENNEVTEFKKDLLHNDSIAESPPKKQLPIKKGCVTKKKKVSSRSGSRKSRSYSPNYRLKNEDSVSQEITLVKNEKDSGKKIIASSINPIVQLVRLPEPKKAKNKRRSRSFSPQGSEKSDGSEVSVRSSTRRKNIVRYQEPSLKVKIRRK